MPDTNSHDNMLLFHVCIYATKYLPLYPADIDTILQMLDAVYRPNSLMFAALSNIILSNPDFECMYGRPQNETALSGGK